MPLSVQTTFGAGALDTEGRVVHTGYPDFRAGGARAESRLDGQRLGPRVRRHPAVSFLLGHAPVGAVASNVLHLGRELVELDLRLLDAEDVGLLGRDEVEKALLPCRANAVDVPGDELHPRAGS